MINNMLEYILRNYLGGLFYMRVGRSNNNWNRVRTKEELLELLKTYRGILSNPMQDYLNSLIELEFSVIRDYIKDEDREALSELEVYKKVAIYNIYNRALTLFKKQEMQFNISGNENGFESLNISTPLNDKNIRLFHFNYSENRSLNDKIPDEYKTMIIGTVNLYQTLESKELREKELNRVMNKLEMLYDAHNPYPSPRKKIGGPSQQWNREHSLEIDKYEKMFTELDNKKELTDEDKREIEITDEIYNLLLEDYGLTKENFEEVRSRAKFGFESYSNLQKTLVKKEPNLTITTSIKYI